jgi:MFS family permease
MKFFANIARSVVVLGFVSLLTDVSSEMIYPMIPLFILTLPGASMMTVGLIEGIAETTASVLKVFSGALSDQWGKRKWLVFAGYGLSALSKPFLALAHVWDHVLLARFSDRFGKGIRGAPRDALIAEATEKEHYGKAFGFHRALDTLGAIIGPLSLLVIFPLIHEDYRMLFYIAALPGFLSLILIFFGVHEQNNRPRVVKQKLSFRGLGKEFLLLMMIMALFTVGNSSDVFLILRANNVGITKELIPLLYVCYNVLYFLFSYPAGIISDKLGRGTVLMTGLLIFACVYFGFAFATQAWQIWGLFTIYGFYIAFTDGVSKAYIADLVPEEKRGTAYGFYSMMTGILLFPASLIAGILWDKVNVSAPFLYGGMMSLLSVLGLLWFMRYQKNTLEGNRT